MEIQLLQKVLLPDRKLQFSSTRFQCRYCRNPGYRKLYRKPSCIVNVIATGNTFGQNDVTFGTYTPSYNGSTQYATVTVKLGNTILTKDRDYKVEYSYRDTKGNTVTTQYPKDARNYSVRSYWHRKLCGFRNRWVHNRPGYT